VGSKFEEQNGGTLPPSCCWTSVAPCSPAEAERRPVEVKGKTPKKRGYSANVFLKQIKRLIID